MWRITLRDLQWRRRRLAIAIVGTSLVFAMTLILAGLSATFRVEADNTLRGIRADAWVVRSGVAGPFSSFATVPDSLASDVAAEPGVESADLLVILHQTLHKDRFVDTNVFGYRIDGIGEPIVIEGRRPSQTGEAVVDESLGMKVDQVFDVAGHEFRVVGLVRGMTFNGGIANVYVPIQDTQAIAFGNIPVATAVVTRGVPQTVPKDYTLMSNSEVRADILRPLDKALRAIDLTQYLLWFVAATIIGSVIYLTAMERVRDFAVLKATGAASRSLLGSLALQSLILSLTAGALASALSLALVRIFPLAVVIPAQAFLLLLPIAVVVGVLASLAGVRRAIAVDPALAFGGP